jgi:hypothetical protein
MRTYLLASKADPQKPKQVNQQTDPPLNSPAKKQMNEPSQ